MHNLKTKTKEKCSRGIEALARSFYSLERRWRRWRNRWRLDRWFQRDLRRFVRKRRLPGQASRRDHPGDVNVSAAAAERKWLRFVDNSKDLIQFLRTCGRPVILRLRRNPHLASLSQVLDSSAVMLPYLLSYLQQLYEQRVSTPPQKTNVSTKTLR